MCVCRLDDPMARRASYCARTGYSAWSESFIDFQMAARTTRRQAHVSRKTRAHFLARKSLNQFLTRLKSQSTSEWPPYLFGAWRILANELRLPDVKGRSIVLKSLTVAQDCVKAQSKRTDLFEAGQAPSRISRTCSRIAKCVKRAPAILRHRLDATIAALIQNSESDLETIEQIFSETSAVFKETQFCSSELSRTALEALKAPRAADYSTLAIGVRRKVMATFAELASSCRQVKAADVFAAMADVLENEKTSKLNTKSRDLRTRYVAGLKKIWLAAELKPGRAIAFLDDSYRSKFHRFAELIYVAMAAPWALRHEDRNSQVEAQPWLALGRTDYEWQISDDHVRNGLSASFKF